MLFRSKWVELIPDQVVLIPCLRAVAVAVVVQHSVGPRQVVFPPDPLDCHSAGCCVPKRPRKWRRHLGASLSMPPLLLTRRSMNLIGPVEVCCSLMFSTATNKNGGWSGFCLCFGVTLTTD